MQETKTYDPKTWLYEGAEPEKAAQVGQAAPEGCHGGHAEHGLHAMPDLRRYHQDLTLQHPRCVFQLLRKHFARYTPEMVERYCGVSKDVFLHAAKTFCTASGPDKTGAICYALGWTQHSSGVQMIRCAAILQLLLGNMGRPGGGILALRGHASIQGSTDVPTLYDILPGYLSMPNFGEESKTLANYVEKYRSRTGWWHNLDKYIVSLLKAYYGESARAENEFGFHWLPRVTGDHSHQGYWLDMLDGKIDGLFVMGQNPAVAGPNSGMERRGLGRLKWLVVREMVETETASFWYESPEVKRGELRTEEIPTEVFLLPAAGHAEKDGTFTNTQRLLQWRQKAVEPSGDSRSENWFVFHLGVLLREKAKRDPRPRNAGLVALRWDYSIEGEHREPVAEEVLQEINGYVVANHELVPGFTALKADGSTACGCWIYSGVFPKMGENRANERAAKGFYGHGWGFAWPSDRRILYNRASARPDGNPWSERKKLVWWDFESKKWTGLDVPDFTVTKAPDYQPPEDAEGDTGLAGDKPFLLHGDGLGWIWVPVGLSDGPLPTHYEPLESPVRNPIYPKRQTNPAAEAKTRPGNEYATSPDARFPFVMMTYRLTEHHTAGGMSRTSRTWRNCSPRCSARFRSKWRTNSAITPGEWVTIVTARGAIEAHALVTPRMQMLTIEGKAVHQVGVPFHWGYSGLVKGDIGNDLIAISEEPNVRIMETKGLLCNVIRGKRAGNLASNRQAARRARTTLMAFTAFLTDATVCIGCKACEVACKEWNEVPEDGLVLERILLRQHPNLRCVDLAACSFSGATRSCRASNRGYKKSISLGFPLRCL